MKKFWLLIAVMCGCSQLMGAITWDTPVTLSTAMTDASQAQIVIHPNGDVTAIWVEGNAILTSSLPFGMSWSSSQTLDASNSSEPRLVVDGSGIATAVWLNSGVVYTAEETPLGTWSSPAALSSSGVTQPALACNSDGDLVAVWTRSNQIEAVTKPTAGSWEAVPTVISTGTSNNPDVGIGGGTGKIVAVWHTINMSGADIVSSATRLIGGSWNSPVNLLQVSSEHSFNYPHVAVDVDGNAAAIVFRYQDVDGDYFINIAAYVTTLPSGGTTWTAFPTKVSTDEGIGDPADLVSKIAFDSFGNAMAIWSISYDSSKFTVESSMRLKGSDWTDAVTLVNPTFYSFDADITSIPMGIVINSYMDFNGSDLFIASSEANINGLIPYIFWDSPSQPSSGSSNAFPKISATMISDTIYAVVCWLNWDGFTTSLEAATGSKVTIAPPSNLDVTQNSIDFGSFIDYYNTVTWDASTDPNVVVYEIYRNGRFFGQVDAMTFQIEDHNVIPMGSVTYGVSAVDNNLSQSQILQVDYP